MVERHGGVGVAGAIEVIEGRLLNAAVNMDNIYGLQIIEGLLADLAPGGHIRQALEGPKIRPGQSYKGVGMVLGEATAELWGKAGNGSRRYVVGFDWGRHLSWRDVPLTIPVTITRRKEAQDA
jgi:hypothetical protein